MERSYYVYFMQSSSRRAPYIGVTSDLEKRVWQHKMGTIDGFTSNHNPHRLVHFERFSTVHAAIAREKQLKRVDAGEEESAGGDCESAMKGSERRVVQRKVLRLRPPANPAKTGPDALAVLAQDDKCVGF